MHTLNLYLVSSPSKDLLDEIFSRKGADMVVQEMRRFVESQETYLASSISGTLSYLNYPPRAHEELERPLIILIRTTIARRASQPSSSSSDAHVLPNTTRRWALTQIL